MDNSPGNVSHTMLVGLDVGCLALFYAAPHLGGALKGTAMPPPILFPPLLPFLKPSLAQPHTISFDQRRCFGCSDGGYSLVTSDQLVTIYVRCPGKGVPEKRPKSQEDNNIQVWAHRLQ